MRSCKCTSHDLYAGGCQWHWQVCVSDVMVSVCMSRCVCVCVIPLALLQVTSWVQGACLDHITSIKVVSRSLPRNSLITRPTLLKSLSGDTEVADTTRYCLDMRVEWGNSCTYCFHHIRGSVSRGTCCTLVSSRSCLILRRAVLMDSWDDDTGNSRRGFVVKFQNLFVINYW